MSPHLLVPSPPHLLVTTDKHRFASSEKGRHEMWTVTNNTPFAAERSWVRDRDGGEIWLVAVKATFSLGPDGQVAVAKEQAPVCQSPLFRGDPAASSLLYDCDLPRKKVGTEVLLHGHAYAPRGREVADVEVSLQVADREKRLRIYGDRVYQDTLLGLRVSEPQPFLKMPITYERAFGGVDQEATNPDWCTWNPVGVGYARNKRTLQGKPAPNIEQGEPRGWSPDEQPVGFGPIASHWQPRVSFGGTCDEKWQRERMPLLPTDFDDRFYQCAPSDQQFDEYLRGGEPVELRNLTPNGRLSFQLPKVRLRYATFFIGQSEPVTHEGWLHTVVLEPDVPRLLMVWHTRLKCHPAGHKLLTTEVDFKRVVGGIPEPWEEALPALQE